MKRTSILVVLILAASLASPAAGAEESPTRRLAEKLDAWRTRVRPALKAAAAEGKPLRFMEEFERLARPFVEDNSALLAQVYAERLARLRKAAEPDPRLYTKREIDLPKDFAEGRKDYAATLRLTQPGPVEVARKWWIVLLNSAEDPKNIPARLTLWGVLPPTPGRLDAPDKSTHRVLLDDGDEKFVVTLKREAGLALPVSIQWWKKK